MVLQPRVRSPFPAHAAPGDGQRPDPVRIAGIAGALLLNAAALMLMLMPLTRPPTAAPPERAQQPDWFEPRPVPPTPPPEEVPVVRQVVQPAPATPTPPVVARELAPVAPPLVEHGNIAADPQPSVETTAGDIAPPSAQATGMQLAYARASTPPYPREALRAGHQGTVVLRVLVDVDGRPLEVTVESGSGYRQLDEAARRHVLRQWRFQPAMRDGQAVQAIGLVPIEFNLERG